MTFSGVVIKSKLDVRSASDAARRQMSHHTTCRYSCGAFSIAKFSVLLLMDAILNGSLAAKFSQAPSQWR